MNRRSFLSWALGTTAAVAVLPTIEALAIDATPQAEMAAWVSTYAHLHLEAYWLFKEFMAGYGLPVAEEFVFRDAGNPTQLGYVLPGDTLVRHQLNVFLDAGVLERSIEPAMRALAARTSSHGIDRYGSLMLPWGGVDYAATRGALRMVKAYSVAEGQDLVRFDVIGGSSPDGLRMLSRRKQAVLKARLLKKWGPRNVVSPGVDHLADVDRHDGL